MRLPHGGPGGGQDFRRNLPIRIGLGRRLTVDSVMLHFAIIRIHLIRRAPSGGTPWLWPFSILSGSDFLTYLRSEWVPHHPILFGKHPYRGVTG